MRLPSLRTVSPLSNISPAGSPVDELVVIGNSIFTELETKKRITSASTRKKNHEQSAQLNRDKKRLQAAVYMTTGSDSMVSAMVSGLSPRLPPLVLKEISPADRQSQLQSNPLPLLPPIVARDTNNGGHIHRVPQEESLPPLLGLTANLYSTPSQYSSKVFGYVPPMHTITRSKRQQGDEKSGEEAIVKYMPSE